MNIDDLPDTPLLDGGIEPPKDRGPDALRFLKENGIIDRTPYIRSRDASLIGCPLKYLLVRRFGIVPALSQSDALSHGTWFHCAFESEDLDRKAINTHLHKVLDARVEELKELCPALGITGERKNKIIEQEQMDAKMALAWVEACRRAPINDHFGTIFDVLGNPNLVTLGVEVIAILKRKNEPDLLIQIDRLLYNKKTNRVWILDLKTSSMAPSQRLLLCPAEFQAIHYLYVLDQLLQSGDLQSTYGLPVHATLGGIIHFAFQKPTIKFGQSDRHFKLDTTPFKSGPRKGQPRNTKEYYGEPDPDLYAERCVQWLLGEGDYQHLKEDREVDPPVGLSFVRVGHLRDEARVQEYLSTLADITNLATRPAEPDRFYRYGMQFYKFGKLDPYTPFFVCLVRDWPAIIDHENFITRDEEDIQDAVTGDPQ